MIRDYSIKQIQLLEEYKTAHKTSLTKNYPVEFKEQATNRMKAIETELQSLMRECYFRKEKN